MSELTREKKCQIAALAAKGWKAEGIAEIAKVDIEAVKALLASRGTEKSAEPPKEDISAMNRTELKAYAVRLYNQGKKHKEIMEITGLSRSVLYTLIPVGKDSKDKKPCKFKKSAQINEDFDKAVSEMIADIKKEPAPAATDTSSEETEHISTINNDTIETTESQALNGVDFIGLFEGMLHEGYGNKAKIVRVNADKEKASVVFECEGRAYGLNFGLAF